MKNINSYIYKISKYATIAAVILLIFGVSVIFSGCVLEDEKDRVNYNITKQADNFNIVRRVTIINCIQGDTLFQCEGRMSINADMTDNQLELLVENPDGSFCKHFIGLSDNVTYVIEDLNLGENEVDKYAFTITYNPNMWIPVSVETID